MASKYWPKNPVGAFATPAYRALRETLRVSPCEALADVWIAVEDDPVLAEDMLIDWFRTFGPSADDEDWRFANEVRAMLSPLPT